MFIIANENRQMDKQRSVQTDLETFIYDALKRQIFSTCILLSYSFLAKLLQTNQENLPRVGQS